MKYRSVFNVKGRSVSQQKPRNSKSELTPSLTPNFLALVQSNRPIKLHNCLLYIFPPPYPVKCRTHSSFQQELTPLREQRTICKQVSALSKKTNSCQSPAFSSILAELPFSQGVKVLLQSQAESCQGARKLSEWYVSASQHSSQLHLDRSGGVWQ